MKGSDPRILVEKRSIVTSQAHFGKENTEFCKLAETNLIYLVGIHRSAMDRIMVCRSG
jgi:hypothetical protein